MARKGDYQASLVLLSQRPVIFRRLQDEAHYYKNYVELANKIMSGDDSIELRDLIVKSSRWLKSHPTKRIGDLTKQKCGFKMPTV